MDRSDAVLPEKVGHVIAARIAHHRHMQFSHQFQYILPESVPVRAWMPGLINPTVYGSAQMLDKGAEDPWIHLRNLVCFVDRHLCFSHSRFLLVTFIIRKTTFFFKNLKEYYRVTFAIMLLDELFLWCFALLKISGRLIFTTFFMRLR